MAAILPLSKQAASYSPADLAGTWQSYSLASGPSVPWWKRATVTVVNPDGTFTTSGTESGGGADSGSGTFSISSTGVITCVTSG